MISILFYFLTILRWKETKKIRFSLTSVKVLLFYILCLNVSALKIHCSAACKVLLDQLGGYILDERGVVSMKGKRDQVTYWLRGEEPAAAAARAKRRAQREEAPPPPSIEKRGQRSSLKSRNWKNQVGGLHRFVSPYRLVLYNLVLKLVVGWLVVRKESTF